MISKTQVLWGYVFILSVIHVLSQLICPPLQLNSGLITVLFFIIFIFNFKIEPMEESDNPIDFRIENRRRR
jgi:hypothetical protein